jgi:hypothetical protein
MLTLTPDMPQLPLWNELALSYRHEAAIPPWEPLRHDNLRIRYEAGNALTTGLETFEFRKDSLSGYQPKTELGKKLLALRQSYVAGGGRLLSADALDEELYSRRGGVGDA